MTVADQFCALCGFFRWQLGMLHRKSIWSFVKYLAFRRPPRNVITFHNYNIFHKVGRNQMKAMGEAVFWYFCSCIRSNVNNKRPTALSFCLWCLTIFPQIQLSSMFADVLFEVQIYSYLFCYTARSKLQNDLKQWKVKGTPYTCLQLLLSYKFLSAFLYGHLFSSYRLFWNKCTNWPQNDLEQLKDQRYQYKTWVHWYKGRVSKLPHLDMELDHWQKILKLHIYFLFTPKGSKLGLFSLYSSGFRDIYGVISKLSYLGMNLGHWQNSQKLHIYSLSTPGGGVEIELTFALRAAVAKIRGEFRNCQIGAWNLAVGQNFRRCTCTLFLPHGV